MAFYEISGIPEGKHVSLQRYLRNAAGRACVETKVDSCAIFFDIEASNDIDGSNEEYRMAFTTCKDVYEIDDIVDPERVVEIVKYSLPFTAKEYDLLDAEPVDGQKPNVTVKAFNHPVKWEYRIMVTVQKVVCVNDGGIDWEQSDRLRFDIVNKLIECAPGAKRLSVSVDALEEQRSHLAFLR